MQGAGLQGRHPRAWKKTTVAGLRPIDAPDLIGQDFAAEQPDTRWCGDITYVQTVDGWVYTATVIDLHSRQVVDYAVAEHRPGRGDRSTWVTAVGQADGCCP